MKSKDYNLIKAATEGNKKALDELLRNEQNNIYTTLYYLKRSDDEISDLAQDVLIKLSKKIYQLKNPANFKSWLNQLIINTYYDYLRKNKKSSEIILTEDSTKFNVADYRNNPQDSVLYNELDMVIKNSIENLPLHYKIPITLREVQGLSYDVISNVTNTTVGTVKSRIARARTIIQNKINKYIKE